MYHSNLEKIFENDKKYEDIANKMSPSYDRLLGALDIVKKFIKQKKLILYGGIAIDYSLRYAGATPIYADDAIPDYDFASPNFYNDSNELADLLAAEGYENVSAINAVHITTRRVRVNYEFVADITYYPENIFSKVPTLEYDGLKFVHPDFQRMDMHIELCYPYDNPPWEVLLHRTRKTIKRFKMLNEAHPVKIGKAPAYDNMTIDLDDISAPISGMVGYACIHKLVYQMFFDTDYKMAKIMLSSGVVNTGLKDRFSKLFDPMLKFGTKTTMRAPKSLCRMTLLNFNVEQPAGEKYAAYLDYIRPPYTLVKNYGGYKTCEVYDMHLKMTPCFNLKDACKIAELPELANISTPIVHMILLYFLQQHHADKDASAMYLYHSCLEICDIVETILRDLYASASGKDAKFAKLIDEIYYSLPLFLSSHVQGDKSVKESYEAFLLSSKYTIDRVPREEQIILRPPSSYKPGGDKQDFNPKESPFFEIDGLRIKPSKK